MQRTEIVRPIGINKDLSPYELPPETWSDGSDIYFRRKRTLKGKGYANVFGLTDSVVTPTFHIYFTDAVDNFWLYASYAAIYKTDGSATPVLMASGFTATREIDWSGCNFNGVTILNNYNDHPQVMAPNEIVVPYTYDSVIDLPNWGTQAADSTLPVEDFIWSEDARCSVIRPYKNYLIAMDCTDDSGKRYPQMLRWSSPAESGDVPPSWDPTSVSEQAGLYSIADSPGNIVDGLTLGDYFMIYKTDAVWMMQFIGGEFVFSFRKLFGEGSGCLTKDCIAEFDGRHFVFSPNGAYIHNGGSQTDIMEPWVKDEYFKNVDPKYILQTKCVADHQNNEVWVYYVSIDSPDTWYDRALIWNWETKEWTIKNLGPNISYVAEGIIEPTATGVNDWDQQTLTWTQNAENIWNDSFTPDPTAKGLLLAGYAKKQFFADGVGVTYDGTPVNGFVKRIGIDFNDDESFKYLTRVTPHILGASPIKVSLFAEDTQTSSPALIATYVFDPAQDQSVDCHVTGRYLGIQFSGTEVWTLTGYTLEWEPVGKF